jgi:acetate kinase
LDVVNILVVNAGSSSLKLRLLDDTSQVAAAKDLPNLDPGGMDDALRAFVHENPGFEAVGHRVVHGGVDFREPTILDENVDEALEALADLAPLHNPPSLRAIEMLRTLRPDLPQVACFDTSFHANLPGKAATYAIPASWRQRWDLRRFGFHGLSHAWASRRAAELLGHPQEGLRLVTAHLGSGASLAAVSSGRSVDTTMGFTPIEGLMMATRSGSVDPGLLTWVQRHGSFTADEVEAALEHDSGLLGVSRVSGDIREVIAAAESGNSDARLAYDLYVYRIQTSVAAMCAAMNGLDGLVFTGGVGERSPAVRAGVCAGLGFLGIRLDEHLNLELEKDGVATAAASSTAVLVVEAREDLEIARHVRELLG